MHKADSMSSDGEPPILMPTWSVRETRRQFEQMGTGSSMSNSFSGDLRPYRGRYKDHVDGERNRMEGELDSFGRFNI